MSFPEAHEALTSLQAKFALAFAADADLNGIFLPGARPDLLPRGSVHLFHSPHMYFSSDGTRADVTWESYGYEPGDTCSMVTTRFAASAVLTKDGWRYEKADWTLMQRFAPLAGGGTLSSDQPAPLCGCTPSAHDSRVLRNLAGILAANNWRNVAQLFTADAQVDLEDLTEGPVPATAWLRDAADYEAANSGRYRCLLLLGPGQLCAVDPAHTAGRWLIQTFEVTSGAEPCIRRRVCLLDMTFTRGDDRWRIAELKLRCILSLPLLKGTGQRYQRMTNPDGNWLYKVYNPDTPCEDIALDIENIFSLWPISVHRGELMHFFRRYLSRPETILSIRSQGPRTPDKVGPAQIAEKLSGMDAVYKPGQLTYHCATTPVLEQPDQNTVLASWIDHSLTNLGPKEDGRADYMVFVTRYDHVFQRVEGRWYLTRFNWEPCLGFPDGSFVSLPGRGQGWASDHPDESYPLPQGLNAIEA